MATPADPGRENLVPGVDFGLPGTWEEFRDRHDSLSHIGEGSFAAVFVLKDKTEDAEVVAKVTNLSRSPNLYKWKSHQAKALLEIKIYYAVQGLDLKSGHENILKFHRWYVTPSDDPTRYKRIISIFERCHSDLQQRFYDEVKRCLHENEAKPVVKQIAQGLHFLHSKNIVHRDIKMRNVLCAHPTELTPVKLCDFNVSRYISPETRPSPMTDPAGTRYTMDPTRLSKKLDNQLIIGYSRKCDCWSLGHIMYELLTFHVLYAEESHCNTADCEAMEEHLDNTRSYNPRLYSDCKACTAKNHQMRVSQPFFANDSAVRNHSEACQDLLNGLLEKSETDRFSITEALAHEWFINS